MKLRRRTFLHLVGAPRRCQPCHALQVRKRIRHGQYDWSLAMLLLVGGPTSPHA
jgi:hypothetical protein